MTDLNISVFLLMLGIIINFNQSETSKNWWFLWGKNIKASKQYDEKDPWW